MGTRGHVALVLLVIMGAWGCVGPTVRTDFDPAADFTTFQTYAFAGMTDVNQGGVLDNSLIRQRIEQMVGQQLSNKGLRKVGVEDNPDLLVHYWVGLKEKQRVESTGPAVGAYGRRGGYGWGAGYSGVTTYDYTEGTLIVDLVTPAKKELVWRGTVVGMLEDSKEKNIQMVNEGLAKAFEDYPPKGTNH
jgi:hypothetical protein